MPRYYGIVPITSIPLVSKYDFPHEIREAYKTITEDDGVSFCVGDVHYTIWSLNNPYNHRYVMSTKVELLKDLYEKVSDHILENHIVQDFVLIV